VIEESRVDSALLRSLNAESHSLVEARTVPTAEPEEEINKNARKDGRPAQLLSANLASSEVVAKNNLVQIFYVC